MISIKGGFNSEKQPLIVEFRQSNEDFTKN